jgi:hypothetical protein
LQLINIKQSSVCFVLGIKYYTFEEKTLKIYKFTNLVTTLTLLLAICLLDKAVYAQTSYTTGFESPAFTLGDVNGQNGWGYLSNSPTKGIIEAAPDGNTGSFGMQSLALRTNNVDFFGVSNHLFSAIIDPAGETNSTTGGTLVAAPYNHYVASFYYQAPLTPVISTRADGRFAELNPSSKGTGANDPANRYAQVRVFNNTNTSAGKIRIEIGWYTLGSSTFTFETVADNLNWGEAYRLNYDILLCDGINQDGSPNDIFRFSLYDSNNTLLGSATGSTWETAYKTGNFGGGITPRAVNGFDFWSQTGPNNTLVGYIDNFSQSVNNVSNPCAILGPTAASATVSGRVVTRLGRGLKNARVALTDSQGNSQTAMTNSFGYYRFINLAVGETYILEVRSKQYDFTPKTITVNSDVENLNISAQ